MAPPEQWPFALLGWTGSVLLNRLMRRGNAMQWRGFDYNFRPILLTKLATKRWCTFHQAWHEG